MHGFPQVNDRESLCCHAACCGEQQKEDTAREVGVHGGAAEKGGGIEDGQ